MDTKTVTNPNYVGGIDNPISEKMDQEMYPPPTQNQPAYPPTAPNQAVYPPAGPNQTVYPPPAQNQTAYPPPGPNQAAYPPTHYPPPNPNQGGYLTQQQQGSVPPMILPDQQPPPYSHTNDSDNDNDIKGDVEANDATDAIVSFSNKNVRVAFTRKVFAILAVQMAVTVGMSALFMYTESIRTAVQSSMGAYISAYVIFLVLVFTLTCCESVARSHPINMIFLGLLTLSMGYMVGTISCFHSTNIVILAFAITFFCTIAVMLFACQTKYDLTSCSGAMFCILCAFILFGIFAGALVPSRYMSMAQCAYSGLGALLYMAFLAMDTQYIIGGRELELDPDDYVFAALMLYMDIINIFLYILQALGSKDD